MSKKEENKQLIEKIEKEFLRRREERISLERQWQLNADFFSGKQYHGITSLGEIVESDAEYEWQSRNVYNHIAPIIDARLSKLSLVKPVVSVRPSTNDASEIENAELAEALLASSFYKLGFEETVSVVTRYSEICGTGFYKVVWNGKGGEKIGNVNGENVYEGEVEIIPVSPFEIYPDNLTVRNLSEQKSLIHARKMDAETILSKYGVTVKNESKNLMNSKRYNADDGLITVIEYYEKPSTKNPNGRLITVGGERVLFEGDLPYVNGLSSKRTYPFIKHVCQEIPDKFFGVSIIERLIPIQRAYNAVKNRKHEFMNRITVGVMTVEDGSVDVDDLADNGLSPGKILIYRQGSRAPEIMEQNTLPQIFNEEEAKLLNEFVIVSGVSDIMSSATDNGVTSGSALEILITQYNERLLISAEVIRKIYVEVATQMLKLYQQFVTGVRAFKNVDTESKTKIFYVDKSVMASDDVYVDSENELLYTPKQKKEMLLDLYKSGLLNDERGRVEQSTKEKLLSLLGYKNLDNTGSLLKLHTEKADTENRKMLKNSVTVDTIDDHDRHVKSHTRFYLSEYENLSDEVKERFVKHIEAHESYGYPWYKE